MCNNKGVKKMATATVFDTLPLNEEQAQKIISTPPKKLPQATVFNDLTLPESERIAHAAKVLASRKCK
jgi:hypothetical protein